MFKKALPIAITFYVAQARQPGQTPVEYSPSDVPVLRRGDMFTLMLSISAKSAQMPEIDQVKVEVVGAATGKREQINFYHNEITLPVDVECLEIPLSADFPVSSAVRGKNIIEYYATANVKGKGAEAWAQAKFEVDDTARQRIVPSIIPIAGQGYEFVLMCDNAVLRKSDTIIGEIVSEKPSSLQEIKLCIHSTDPEGKLQNLGGITLCTSLISNLHFEMPLTGFDVESSINWYSVVSQTFLVVEVVRPDGQRDEHFTEIVIM